MVALPTLRHDFVEDDRWVVAQRAVLQHPPSIRALLTEPYWPRSFRGSLWRPAVLASWALDYRAGGRPLWFHAVNAAWAALAAALLAFLAARLGGTGVGLATGLLFAVHPVHVEAFAPVVGRAELMAAAGYAAALLGALRARQRRAWLLGVVLAATLAIGAKEHAATLPAVMVLVLAARGARPRDMIAPVLCAALPVAAYFALRPAVTGAALASGGMAPGLEHLGMGERARVMLGLSLEWWRLLLFPLRLSADYSPAQVEVSAALGPRQLVAAVLWIAAALGAWRARSSAPGVALGLAWFVVTIAPVANVLVPTEILVAERTLYLPSFGVLFALVSAAALLPAPARLRSTALAVLVLACAARSIMRERAWRDDESFYQALLVDAPRSYRTLWLQGNDAFAQHRSGTGERLLREAIAAAPGIPGPREDLAGYYAGAGLWGQAQELLESAIPLNETRVRPWLTLPGVMLGKGDTAAAVSWAERGVAKFPDDADMVAAGLTTLLAAGRCDAAQSMLDAHGAALAEMARGRARGLIARCRPGQPPA